MTPEEITALRQVCARVRVSRPTHHVHCANSISTLLDRLEEAIGLLRDSEGRVAELERERASAGRSVDA